MSSAARTVAMNVRRFLGNLTSFVILAAVLALFFGYRQIAGTIIGDPIDVRAQDLPYYALCSLYRMLAAYVVAVAFSLVYGMVAARRQIYERLMIPAIDIAQSVPVVGFFPAAVYFFVAMGQGERFGIELAAVFLIFTSMTWNMTLGVFEAMKTVPEELALSLDSLGASTWVRIKRLYLPASVPRLVYNSILSWVNGWYFLIACEIITVGPARYRLPGLGSFLMEAADAGRPGELVAGLAVLLAVIIAMDLLIWQPLSVWAEKYRYEFASGQSDESRSLGMLSALRGLGPGAARATRALMRPLIRVASRLVEVIPNAPLRDAPGLARALRMLRLASIGALLAFIAYSLVLGAVALVTTLSQPWPEEARLLPAATGASMLRLGAAYVISLLWTVPCALWASESARFNRWIAPAAEILGSVPATALFPVIVVFVIHVTGGMNLASVLLALTGMQWYLLFNLLAGANQLPEDLKEVPRAFGLSRLATWRRLVLPAMLPAAITGSITAWGAGWNALIIAEYFVYQGQTYKVLGLGALLDEATYETGDGTMILLSLLTMVGAVLILNRLVWRRLYEYAVERCRLDY
jgi:NitT/TauT family transport system permease protein